jgi:hypothetical protein
VALPYGNFVSVSLRKFPWQSRSLKAMKLPPIAMMSVDAFSVFVVNQILILDTPGFVLLAA